MNDRVFDADIYSVAGKLALELECLLIDTKDLSVVSKWWDSAHDALEQWRSIKDTASQPVKFAEQTCATKGEHEVELTDEEIRELDFDMHQSDADIVFARAVIAAHKEKQRAS